VFEQKAGHSPCFEKLLAEKDEANCGRGYSWKYFFDWKAMKRIPAFPQDVRNSETSTSWSRTCLL
jgi:hypothetical protein